MIVRLNLEHARPSLPDVYDAGIFTWPLHHQSAARRQTLQVNPRGLVGAMFTPHHAENAKFGERGFASTQQSLDFFVFVRREPMLPDKLRSNGKRRRQVHRGSQLLSHFAEGLDREVLLTVNGSQKAVTRAL
jgi:hypothetical protein